MILKVWEWDGNPNDAEQHSIVEWDEGVIRSKILNFCVKHQVKTCSFSIYGIADCYISLDNKQGLDALFG
jgi:hypothetical protein